MRIEGKKAVIVGGASGFGRTTAEALAARGASVAVLDLPNSAGQQVADALNGAFYPADVTDFAGTERALDRAVQRLGGLHVVVTTAGGGGPGQRTFGESGPHDLDAFRAILDLNVVATFNVNRLAAAQMSRNEPEDDERGVIVNTSSLAAFGGQAGLVAVHRRQSRDRRDVPDDGARPRRSRHPSDGDRAQPVRDGHDGRRLRR